MKKTNSKIDVVVTWVDGSDPVWLEEKKKYDPTAEVISSDSSNSAQRYRDWGLMRYWFRGIEKYMPFVNKIFFVTWGHVPEWLNTDNDRLVVVNHRDYIPEKYLPTYNSNVIELNLHRIKELSENFILFNDDVFAIAPAKEELFFKNDLPCDMLLSEIMYNYDVSSVFRHAVFNDLGIINKHFGMQRRGIKNFPKWVNPVYGTKNMLTNLNKFSFKRIIGFRDQHLTTSHKKSVFKKMWDLEGDNLDRACMNRFRTAMDFNHWLMRYWNLVTGEFEPINISKLGDYGQFDDSKSIDMICDRIRKHEKPILVINDNINSEDEQLFLDCKRKIAETFESILPDTCSFEKLN